MASTDQDLKMEDKKIQLLKDEQVLVQYKDADLDILNKKNVKIGSRDVIYSAKYKNKAVASNVFREKKDEYRQNKKQIQSMIDNDKSEIEKLKANSLINESSLIKIDEMCTKLDDLVAEIKEL